MTFEEATNDIRSQMTLGEAYTCSTTQYWASGAVGHAWSPLTHVTDPNPGVPGQYENYLQAGAVFSYDPYQRGPAALRVYPDAGEIALVYLGQYFTTHITPTPPLFTSPGDYFLTALGHEQAWDPPPNSNEELPSITSIGLVKVSTFAKVKEIENLAHAFSQLTSAGVPA
jgi:hypothetical protein